MLLACILLIGFDYDLCCRAGCIGVVFGCSVCACMHARTIQFELHRNYAFGQPQICALACVFSPAMAQHYSAQSCDCFPSPMHAMCIRTLAYNSFGRTIAASTARESNRRAQRKGTKQPTNIPKPVGVAKMRIYCKISFEVRALI